MSNGKRIGKYDLGVKLGQGTFGKVVAAANHITGEKVAIKIIDKKGLSADAIRRLKNEIAILKLVKHPCIVDLKECLASSEKIYIVLQLVQGGEVWQPGQKVPESVARRHFQRLLDGLEWCHKKGIAHRDLKPENLLLDENGNLIISDFGLCSEFPESSTHGSECTERAGSSTSEEGLFMSDIHLSGGGKESGNSGTPGARPGMMMFTFCGSPNYIAPEVLLEEGYDGCVADIWSCGVILFTIVSGFLPFDEPQLHRLTDKIMAANYRCPPTFSEELKGLLKMILVPDPTKRASLSRLRSHPWVKQDYVPVNPVFEPSEDDILKNNDLEVFESCSLKRSSLISTPSHSKSLNAFDLITMSNAFNLESIFSPNKSPTGNSQEGGATSVPPTRVTSNQSGEVLFERVAEVANKEGFKVFFQGQEHSKLKIVSETETIGFVASAEVFEMTPNVFMLEIKFVKGSAVAFVSMCQRIQKNLEDILLK